MNILEKFTKRNRGNVLHSAYGDFKLATKKGQNNARKLVVELQRRTDALTRKDIKDWRNAWQMAINVENPNRYRLYDIYQDVQIDNHLSGCIAQRKGFVMAKEFKLMDSHKKENEDAHKYFDKEWFKQLIAHVLDAPYFGHSLIELGNITEDGNGNICYDGVHLIPRKHVIPEYGRVVLEAGQSWQDGIDYRLPPYTDYLIEAGRPDDLGLFLKAAPQTISKKNNLSFWDTFAETFGMPMRVAKTTSRDDKEIDKLEKMLRDAGTSLYAIMPADTDIEFIENSRGDSFNVYDRRIDRANSELSKLIIGQTMTIEDGSSLSQSQTHLEVFENIIDSDRDMLRDVINNQLIPRMIRHGFPLAGLTFEWDDTINYTPEQQVAFETMIADRYEVDPIYFEEKYGMPVGERRQIMMPESTDDTKGDNIPRKDKVTKTVHPFFD